jgi:hypothetical protein
VNDISDSVPLVFSRFAEDVERWCRGGLFDLREKGEVSLSEVRNLSNARIGELLFRYNE